MNQVQSKEISNQLQTFVQLDTCDVSEIPCVKFFMFQLGCHYSRLMWMLNHFDVSLKFNQFALGPWRNLCDRLRRVTDCTQYPDIDKTSFVSFSIHWLFQYADTLLKLEKYEEVKEIYKEIELICTDNISDYRCLKEALYCRNENLNFLLERGLNPEDKHTENPLNFEDFIDNKNSKQRQHSSSSPINSSIYIDLPQTARKQMKTSSEEKLMSRKKSKDVEDTTVKLSSRRNQNNELEKKMETPSRKLRRML